MNSRWRGATARRVSSRWRRCAAPVPVPRAAASPTSWARSSAPTSRTTSAASNCATFASSAGMRCSPPGTTATTPASTPFACCEDSMKLPARKFVAPRAEREKREELKTYRDLSLRRDLKSLTQRRRVEAGGLRRVLGDGSGTQPYLIVDARRYREVRLEVQRRLLVEARHAKFDLPADLLLGQLKPRIEAL